MNLFVAWKMNTHYLRLHILGGYEHVYCVDDENTYYLELYILGYEHFCRASRIHILYTFIYHSL